MSVDRRGHQVSDLLFLLKAEFADAQAGAGLFYCPSCATLAGVLSYFPGLKKQLRVIEVDFPRPRLAVAELLGSEHPGCPVLVLHEPDAVKGVTVKYASTGRAYIDGAADIGRYLALNYGIAAPHP